MDRRAFLRRLGVSGSAAVFSLALGGCVEADRSPRKQTAKPARSRPAVEATHDLPVAQWLIEENRRPGTVRWVIEASSQSNQALIEGFCDQVSAAAGDEVALFVNTSAPSFHADVYRMGYYDGLGGRFVTRTDEVAGRVQPAATFTPGINMVSCKWQPSWRFQIGTHWLPGNYLIVLRASNGAARYVPLTIRDDKSRAAIAMQNSVTTWQAYNRWGGYSLYGGTPLDGRSEYESRSRVVSFDRPYLNPDAFGSGDWMGNEFPFLYLAERHGLDLAYLTNVDVDRDPGALSRHRVLVSLGHDEYWSYNMRYGVQREALRGLNVAFLGANACYRQIRFGRSPLGERRHEICYKDYLADPIHKRAPWLATGVSWATTPDQTPESEFVGAMYQNFGASGDLVVFDATSFIYQGTGLRKGSRVPNVIGSEYDAYEPAICPKNVEILAHSPTHGVRGYSDMTYYTTAHGGGVFDSGTANFVTSLWDGHAALARRLEFAPNEAATPLGMMLLNLLRLFGTVPASHERPSVPNWQSLYATSSPVVLGQDP